jgi:hypothetical protein
LAARLSSRKSFEGGVGDDDPLRNGDAEIQRRARLAPCSALNNITGLTERTTNEQGDVAGVESIGRRSAS